MVDSIIFDLDGTLWDTTHVGAKIWSEAASKYNVYDKVTADQLKNLYGLPTEIIVKKLVNTFSLILLTISSEFLTLLMEYETAFNF